MLWYALLIPVLTAVIGWVFFKTKIVWWEILVPVVISVMFIFISYYTMKSTTLSDVEYNGYVIVKARHYDYWSTWVDATCSYTTTCCCDSKGRGCITTTHYYDCSYCDENSEYWVMYDSGGHEISITEEHYHFLLNKWDAKEEFVELDRNIDYHGSCGVDGDAQEIKWNKKIETSETTTYESEFTNILKSNHSAFNYPTITEEKAKESGLYEYPKINKYNYQRSVLGLQKFNSSSRLKILSTLDYINGVYGYKYKVKVFTLFFKNKDIDIAFQQEAYWDGGNQNEIVVCIGLDNAGNMTWVKPFSWCDDKRVLIDIREDLMESSIKDEKTFYRTYTNAIKSHWHYKSFKDFNYLSFEPTTGQLLLVYIVTIFISIGSMVWAVLNDEDAEI